MDTILSISGWVLTGIGALTVLLTGLAGALRLLAPKTKSDLDDRALGFVDKLVAGLRWVDEKLLALLGTVARAKVERRAPEALRAPESK